MIRLTARRTGAIIIALATAGLLSACSSPAASSAGGKLQDVTVMLDWSPNTNHTGMYLAQAQGFYADEGLNVKFVQPGDTDPLQLLAAGKADFAISASESLIPAREQGAPVVSIAAIIQENTSALISLSSTGISTPADLNGHSYGSYGGPIENQIVNDLAKCGGDPNASMKDIPLTGVDFQVGLSQHMYDTAWVYNAWDTIRLRDIDHMDVQTINFSDYPQCIPNWYTPIIATSESTLKNDPDLVTKFLSATAKGYQMAMTDPQAGVDALMKADPELDRNLVTQSAQYLSTRYAATPAEWGHQEASVWNGFSDYLKKNGLISKDFDVSKAWTDVPLSEAVGASPSASATSAGNQGASYVG